MTLTVQWPEKKKRPRKRPTFCDATTGEVWETSAEIPYWWNITTQVWVVILISWSKIPTQQDQSEALARSGSDPSSVWNFGACFPDISLYSLYFPLELNLSYMLLFRFKPVIWGVILLKIVHFNLYSQKKKLIIITCNLFITAYPYPHYNF